MKKVGILYHPMKEQAGVLARKLEKFLAGKGISVWMCSAWEGEKARIQIKSTDLVISIGGDGTILRAAQVVVPYQIPITGINLGQLGFMTELSTEETLDQIPALLAGEGWTDERAMLMVELSPNKNGESGRSFHALNDVVIARGSVPRMIYVEASINGEHLTTYHVDGVIVSTATGSTGYALAASGTIVHPQSKDLLLVPILSHLTPGYALVLPETAEVQLTVHTDSDAVITVDGYVNSLLADGATILLKRSPHTTRFLRIHPNTYWGSLERKLKGKC